MPCKAESYGIEYRLRVWTPVLCLMQNMPVIRVNLDVTERSVCTTVSGKADRAGRHVYSRQPSLSSLYSESTVVTPHCKHYTCF